MSAWPAGVSGVNRYHAADAYRDARDLADREDWIADRMEHDAWHDEQGKFPSLYGGKKLKSNGRGKKARRLRRHAKHVRSPYYARKLRSKADRLLMERAIDKSAAISHLFGGDAIDAAANMYLAHNGLTRNGKKKAKKWGRRARMAAAQMRYGRSRRSRGRARGQMSYARYKERKHWRKHAKKKWLKSIGAWDFVKAAKKGKKSKKWKGGESASSTPSSGDKCSAGTGACYAPNGWRRKSRKWGRKSRKNRSYGRRRSYSRGRSYQGGWRKKQWKNARRAMEALWWSNLSPSSSSSSSSYTSSSGRLRDTASQAYCAGGSCDYGSKPRGAYTPATSAYAGGFSPRTGPLPKSALIPNRRRNGRRKKASYHGEHMAKHRKRRRGSARRRSRKYGFRRKARRSNRRSRSRGRSRGRGRRRSYRRNGEDAFEMNEMTPNRGRYGKRWGKKRYGYGSSRGRYYGRKGFARHGFGLDPLAMFAKMGVENSSMGPEDKLKMLRRLSDPYMPRQSAYRKITVPVDVPYGIGKHKKMKVRFGAKVRTAFGPYKRRYGKRGLTYEYAKGKHIPDWALIGAPSEQFARDNWPMFTKQMDAILSARGKRREQLAKKLAKLQERVSKMDVSPDAYTPNRRRGRKARRRGKKRFYRTRNRLGQFTRRKGRKGGRRRFRKSWGKKRRGRGRRRFRRNGKKRGRGRSRRGRSSKRRSRKGHRRHKRGKSRRRSRRGRGRSRRRGRGRSRGKRGRSRRFRRNGMYTMNGMLDAIVPTITMGAVAGLGLLAHKGVKNLLVTKVFSSVDDSYKAPLASLVAGMALGAASTMVPHGMEAGVGVFASVFHDLATWVMMKAGATQAAAYLLGLGDIPVQSIRGFGRLGRLGEYELRGFRGLGEYELRGLGQAPMQAMAGASYAQAAAGLGFTQAMAGAGYGEYELAGGVFDGIRPNNGSIMRALNQADSPVQAAAGLGGDYVEKFAEDGSEYVPTFLRPNPQMFAQDSLLNIGVPGTSILSAERAGVGEKDIWIPGQDQVVVNDPGPGGIFSDPAAALAGERTPDAHFAWWVGVREVPYTTCDSPEAKATFRKATG